MVPTGLYETITLHAGRAQICIMRREILPTAHGKTRPLWLLAAMQRTALGKALWSPPRQRQLAGP